MYLVSSTPLLWVTSELGKACREDESEGKENLSFAFKLSPRSFQPRCWNSLKNDPLSPFHAKAMSLEVCRYNTMHYVAKEEMQKHYLECESANRAIQDSKPVVSLVLKLKTIFFLGSYRKQLSSQLICLLKEVRGKILQHWKYFTN